MKEEPPNQTCSDEENSYHVRKLIEEATRLKLSPNWTSPNAGHASDMANPQTVLVPYEPKASNEEEVSQPEDYISVLSAPNMATYSVENSPGDSVFHGPPPPDATRSKACLAAPSHLQGIEKKDLCRKNFDKIHEVIGKIARLMVGLLSALKEGHMLIFSTSD